MFFWGRISFSLSHSLEQVVRCNGLELLSYKDDLLDVLNSTIHVKCKKAFHFAAKVEIYVPNFLVTVNLNILRLIK